MPKINIERVAGMNICYHLFTTEYLSLIHIYIPGGLLFGRRFHFPERGAARRRDPRNQHRDAQL